MKDIKRNLKRWKNLNDGKTKLLLLAVCPFFFVVNLMIRGIPIFDQGVIRYTLSMLTIGTVLLCGGQYCRMQTKKIIENNRSTEPWKISFGMRDKNEIFGLLESKIQMTRTAEDCLYGKYNSSGYEWRVFVFTFDNDGTKDDLKCADEFVYKVNETTGFSISTVAQKQLRPGRIQIFIYDSVPYNMIDSAGKSAEYRIMMDESQINVLISLNEGILYVPFMQPALDAVIKCTRYMSALDEIEKLLEI